MQILRLPKTQSAPFPLVVRASPAFSVSRFRVGRLLLAAGALWLAVSGGTPSYAAAQGVVSGAIQGRVWDQEGVPVPSVLVRLFRLGSADALRGAETDGLGYYHLDLLGVGPYLLEVERLGFGTQTRSVEVAEGQRLTADFTLAIEAVALEGISVEAERSRERIRFEKSTGETVRELAGREIKGLPGLVEADPLRAIEALPGVVTTSDFSSAFNVRGGSADQNLILLDGIPVFNPTHLGGFFSVFNGDMIERSELRSGGFPARYGGRVSSVLEIQTDPGNGEFHGDAGISALATRLALGGGLPATWREKAGLRSARWRVSGRRSYFDKLLAPFQEFPYHLSDLQGVLEGWTEGGNRISINAYTGRDVLDLTRLDEEEFPLRVDWDWGNDLVGVRWTHPREDGGWMELRTGLSRFNSGLLFPDFEDTEIRTAISQATLEGDLELRPTPYMTVTTGAGIARRSYDNLFSSGGTVFAAGDGAGTEAFSYLQGEWRPSLNWILEVGFRGDGWASKGEGDVLVFSPRAAAKRFFASSQWAVKGSAGRYTQFLHSLRDEELPVGLDVWILAGEEAPHVLSDQVQLGLEGFPREGWFVSLEGYYRDFEGVVTTNLAENPNDPLDDYLPGTGWSYGADLFLRRSRGATTGWFSLSLLRTTRTFPDFVSGLDPPPEITYPPVFDRRVDADLVLQRDLGHGLDAGFRFNFGSGLPYTRPTGSYVYLAPRILPGAGLQGEIAGVGGSEEDFSGVVLSDRNGVRYPHRHRLDVSLRWAIERSWGRMTPYVSILNLYNQKNVLFYFYEYDQDPPVRTGISMFPFLPSLGMEVHF
jgi:hypothetical protein